MREIKFRFWDANTKVMDYDRRYIPWADEEINVDTFFDTSEEPTESTWLQFTGIKDKNGVEIYEGDFIEIKMKYGTEIFEVYYKPERARFSLRDYSGDGWGFDDSNDMRVIGNIYENPELLGR